MLIPAVCPGVQVHETDVPAARGTSRETYSGTLEQDRELEAIFERTYGPIRAVRAGQRALRGSRRVCRRGTAGPVRGRNTCWWTDIT